MRELSMKELIDLVVAEVPEAETRIQKMFEWHFERVKIVSQWFLAAAASLSISVLVTFFRGGSKLVWWQNILVLFLAFATATPGLYRLRQLRSLNRQFVAALKLYSEFKKIKTFLIRYREATR